MKQLWFKTICFSATILMIASINLSATTIISTTQQFNDYQVPDPKMEARCQNFADNGATYEFKIVDGHVYYCKDGQFQGEFSIGNSGPVYLDHKTTRNNAVNPLQPSDNIVPVETQIPSSGFSMITARNNRVMAKAATTNQLFWASIVQEYVKDYKDYKNDGAWQSVPGAYAKVDPQDDGNITNPLFDGDKNHHYATQGFKNTKDLLLPPELNTYFASNNVTLAGNAPDLGDVSTRTYASSPQTLPLGPILPDVMQVKVKEGRWYLIDATPPRNFTNATKEQLAGTSGYYETRKRLILKELSAYLVKVAADMLATPDASGKTNDQKIKDLFKVKVDEAAGSIKRKLNVTDAWLVAGYVSGTCGLPAFAEICTYETGARTFNAAVDANAASVKDRLNTLSFYEILKSIERFYNSTIDFAIDHGNEGETTILNNLINSPTSNSKVLKDEVFNIISRVADGSVLKDEFMTELRKETDKFCNPLIDSLLNFNPRKFSPIKTCYGPDAAKRWPDIAKGINSWYKYFTYPSNVFEMENITTPYPNSTTPTYNKTRVKIKDILGVGIASAHRYEHYRMHLGGEYGTWFGKIDSPENWDLYLASNPDPENMFDGVDGHGYVDGTCNFYILAVVGMKKPTETQYTDTKVLMWIDEQEYFAERWHVLHPRDNAFEGLPATFSSAFPVLTWFNGLDMNAFESTYGTPYKTLTSNARMATSGTATVIADNDKIYSSSFFWAITDATWRWRAYPAIASGESIDKQSVKLRDDMTINFKGTKIVNDIPIDGYWYQKYLDPNNTKPGTLVSGGMPTTGFTHPWSFMAKDAFNVADKSFYKMGMYEQITNPSSSSDQHYFYKGYTPRTHIFKIDPSATIKASNNATYSPTGFVNQTLDPNNVFALYHNASATDSITHPMYKDMDPQFRQAIKLKFLNVNNVAYAYFPDIRNDDIKLLNSVGKYLYCKPVSGSSVIITILKNKLDANGNEILDANGKMIPLITDLNVWADAPIDKIDISHNSSNNSLGFQFALNNYKRYLLTSLKIGYIKNGSTQILSTIAIPTTNYTDNGDIRSYNFTSAANSVSKVDWETYLSVEGRIRYGTSVWVQDAFGNGNAILNLASVGIPAPVITISAVNASGSIATKPAITGQPVTFGYQANGGGSISSMTWDFGDGTPIVTSFNPPPHRYSKPGTYTVTVTAIGPDFPTVKTMTVKINANILPILQLLLD